ncbi:exostosin 3 [Elysia marginata]|uniref:Exostosin 3 n=1 Tax=Elysia marginata TaxID=1093978 RepID=A0AAV4GE20_9GAST|nr:exostosin 3 [Elysia marginata]
MPLLSKLVSFAATAAARKVVIMRRISKKIHSPHVWPAFKLLLVLLALVVLLSLVGHHYLSNIGSSEGLNVRSADRLVPDGHNRVLGPNNYPFPDQHGYETDPAGGRPQLAAYKKEIEELRQIKASVSNELRDLESRRLRLQTTIQQYKVS